MEAGTSCSAQTLNRQRVNAGNSFRLSESLTEASASLTRDAIVHPQ
jgi:hypothetical protein